MNAPLVSSLEAEISRCREENVRLTMLNGTIHADLLLAQQEASKDRAELAKQQQFGVQLRAMQSLKSVIDQVQPEEMTQQLAENAELRVTIMQLENRTSALQQELDDTLKKLNLAEEVRKELAANQRTVSEAQLMADNEAIKAELLRTRSVAKALGSKCERLVEERDVFLGSQRSALNFAVSEVCCFSHAPHFPQVSHPMCPIYHPHSFFGPGASVDHRGHDARGQPEPALGGIRRGEHTKNHVFFSGSS